MGSARALSELSPRGLREAAQTGCSPTAARFAAAARAARFAPPTKEQPGRYPGTCRDRQLAAGDAAVRVRVDPGPVIVRRRPAGRRSRRTSRASLGDYVIVRRDGLPAYHLAVVLDDAEQGVTTVVRGVDLLDSTAAHVHLQRVLGLATPQYYHVPVVVNERRQKLSKQTGAAAVEAREPASAATVLELLGLAVPPGARGRAAARAMAAGRSSAGASTLCAAQRELAPEP